MSANNTIVILSMKNEWRVAHVLNTDNFYCTYTGKELDTPLPQRIFERFQKCQPLSSKEEAFDEARKLYNKLQIVEYGIQELEINKTWSAILKNARKEIPQEKMEVLSREDISPETKYYIVDQLNFMYSNILREIVKLGDSKDVL